MDYILVRKDELYHYGVKGMKWGKRKQRLAFTQTDGYRKVINKIGSNKTINKAATKLANNAVNRSARKGAKASDADIRKGINAANKLANSQQKTAKNDAEAKAARQAKAKKAVKIGAAVAGTALAAYGAYKVSEAIKSKAFKTAYERGVKANADYMRKYNQGIFTEARLTGDKKSLINATRKSDNLSTRLHNDNMDYAKRHSKNLVESVKTLRGKNREFTSAELLNMGITPWKYVDDDLLYKRRS